nr:MAG TPA_asm: hypothetical protein [Caudoviricetes sp.]
MRIIVQCSYFSCIILFYAGVFNLRAYNKSPFYVFTRSTYPSIF